jgi:DUF2934 family protein
MPAYTTPAGSTPHREPTEREVVDEAAAIYPASEPGGPTPEEIAEEAYRIYLGRGSEHGQDVDDWLEAERRLVAVRVRR